MNIHKIALFLLIFLWFIPWTSFAMVVDRIVAKVNGDIITLSELKKRVSTAAKLRDENKLGKRKLFRRDSRKALDKIIDEKLILQFARIQKIEPTKDAIDDAIEEIKKNNNFSDKMLVQMLQREGFTLPLYRKQLKQQITLSKVLGAEVRSRINISEKDVADYYQSNQGSFLMPEEIRAYHIIFVVSDKTDKGELEKQKNKALDVLKLVRKGGNFQKLARTYSEGPSKEAGGDLGWVKRGAMIPAFEKAAFALKKDTVSDLVKTDYGYHIIKIEDRKTAVPRTLDQSREEIRKKLFSQKYDAKYNSWVSELKKNSYIEDYLDKKTFKRTHTSLSHKKKRVRAESNKSNKTKKHRKKKAENKPDSKAVVYKEKVKISKLILNWEKAHETKNRRRYISFYSDDFKTNGLTRKEWERKTLREYGKYKFINVEIRDFRVFKRKNYYVAAFEQRLKTNIDDQIRLVRLYLVKNGDDFEISREKWLKSADTFKEFSNKPLLSKNTLPKESSKLTRKKKSAKMVRPLGLL